VDLADGKRVFTHSVDVVPALTTPEPGSTAAQHLFLRSCEQWLQCNVHGFRGHWKRTALVWWIPDSWPSEFHPGKVHACPGALHVKHARDPSPPAVALSGCVLPLPREGETMTCGVGCGFPSTRIHKGTDIPPSLLMITVSHARMHVRLMYSKSSPKIRSATRGNGNAQGGARRFLGYSRLFATHHHHHQTRPHIVLVSG
jgi:hypothetical protein